MDEVTVKRAIGLGMLGGLILVAAIVGACLQPKIVLPFEAALIYCLIAAYLIVSGEKS